MWYDDIFIMWRLKKVYCFILWTIDSFVISQSTLFTAILFVIWMVYAAAAVLNDGLLGTDKAWLHQSHYMFMMSALVNCLSSHAHICPRCQLCYPCRLCACSNLLKWGQRWTTHNCRTPHQVPFLSAKSRNLKLSWAHPNREKIQMDRLEKINILAFFQSSTEIY